VIPRSSRGHEMFPLRQPYIREHTDHSTGYRQRVSVRDAINPDGPRPDQLSDHYNKEAGRRPRRYDCDRAHANDEYKRGKENSDQRKLGMNISVGKNKVRRRSNLCSIARVYTRIHYILVVPGCSQSQKLNPVPTP